jgi:hypothetical protein
MSFPKKLPNCSYPTAAVTAMHGFQPLPVRLPILKWSDLSLYRGLQGEIKGINTLDIGQIKTLARVIGASFTKNEPMTRYLVPPKNAPEGLDSVVFKDFWGKEKFGEWTLENLLYWVIRLFVLGNPTSTIDAIAKNEQTFEQSFALFNTENKIVGGAFNMRLAYNDERELRKNDPVIDGVLGYFEPIITFLLAQEHTATVYLCEKYPDFKTAASKGEVGNHFMIAKAPELPSEYAFEIFAQSMEIFKKTGYKYVITEATNQWTGAACLAIGGVAVHFAPFRDQQRVPASNVPIENKTTSIDGFLSNKDSGSMFFVLRLS